MGNKKETSAATEELEDILYGLKLHVSKIGIYSNDLVKQALLEDIEQLSMYKEKIKL